MKESWPAQSSRPAVSRRTRNALPMQKPPDADTFFSVIGVGETIPSWGKAKPKNEEIPNKNATHILLEALYLTVRDNNLDESLINDESGRREIVKEAAESAILGHYEQFCLSYIKFRSHSCFSIPESIINSNYYPVFSKIIEPCQGLFPKDFPINFKLTRGIIKKRNALSAIYALATGGWIHSFRDLDSRQLDLYFNTYFEQETPTMKSFRNYVSCLAFNENSSQPILPIDPSKFAQENPSTFNGRPLERAEINESNNETHLNTYMEECQIQQDNAQTQNQVLGEIDNAEEIMQRSLQENLNKDIEIKRLGKTKIQPRNATEEADYATIKSRLATAEQKLLAREREAEHERSTNGSEKHRFTRDQKELSRRLKENKEMLNHAAGENGSLRQQIIELEKRHMEETNSSQTHIHQIEELLQKNKEGEGQLNYLQNELRNTKEACSAEISKANEMLNHAAAENGSLRQQMIELEKRHMEETNSSQTHIHQIERHLHKNKEGEGQLNYLQNELRNTKEACSAEISKANEMLNHAAAENGSLRQQMIELEKRYMEETNSLQTHIHQIEQHLHENAATFKDMQHQLDQDKKKIQSSEATIKKHRGEISEQRKEIEQFKKEIQKKEHALIAAEWFETSLYVKFAPKEEQISAPLQPPKNCNECPITITGACKHDFENLLKDSKLWCLPMLKDQSWIWHTDKWPEADQKFSSICNEISQIFLGMYNFERDHPQYGTPLKTSEYLTWKKRKELLIQFKNTLQDYDNYKKKNAEEKKTINKEIRRLEDVISQEVTNIKNLEEEKTTLQIENKNQKTKINDFKEKIEKVQDQLKVKDKELLNLINSQQDKNAFQEQLEEKEKSIKSLNQKLYKEVGNSYNLKDQLKEKDKELLNLTNLQKEKNVFQEQLKEKEESIKSLNQELLKEVENSHKLQNLINSQQEKNAFQEQLKEKEESIKSLNQELLKEVENSHKLQDQLKEKDKELLNLTDLQKEKNVFQEQLEEKEESIKSLNQELLKEVENSHKLQNLINSQQEKNAFQEQLKEKEESIKSLNQELLKEVENSHKLQDQLKEKDKELLNLTDLQQEINKLQKLLEGKKESVKNLNQKLKEKDNELLNLTNLQQEKNVFQEQLKEKEEFIKNLNQELLKEVENSHKLQCQLKKNQKKNQQVPNLANQEKHKKTNLKSKISQLEIEKETLRNELSILTKNFESNKAKDYIFTALGKPNHDIMKIGTRSRILKIGLWNDNDVYAFVDRLGRLSGRIDPYVKFRGEISEKIAFKQVIPIKETQLNSIYHKILNPDDKKNRKELKSKVLSRMNEVGAFYSCEM